jgi:hypothetical protein
VNHPNEASLALYAGGELGLWGRLKIGRHARECDRCSRQVEEFRALRDFTLAESGQLPAGVGWEALAAEMKANIRVGLAAGECVAAEAPVYASPWRTPALVLPVLLIVIAGWILQTLPPTVKRSASMAASDIVLEADSQGIGIQSAGRGFTLLHPRADNVVFSVRGESAVRARYVDADTGQVTISHVYVQ